jgi:ACS family hexuronate transporter-like MFS transporter
MCLTVGFDMATIAPFYSVNVNVDVAKEPAGSAIGIMCWCGLLAAIISPSVSGYLLDWTQSFNSMFFFMSGLAFLSCLITCYSRNTTFQVMR